MTPRSLFHIVLKVFGLILVKEMLVAIPALFGFFAFVGSSSYTGFGPGALLALSLLIYGWIAWQLLMRTNQIIDLFKLDKNFPEENLAMNLHRSSVVMIAVILIGGWMVVNAIPEICNQLIQFWRLKSQSLFMENSPASLIQIIAPSIKLLAGLLVLGYARSIVNFIELKRRR